MRSWIFLVGLGGGQQGRGQHQLHGEDGKYTYVVIRKAAVGQGLGIRLIIYTYIYTRPSHPSIQPQHKTNTKLQQLVTRGDKQYVIALPIDTPVVVVDEKYSALELGFDTRLPAMIPTVRA
jgi:hypothetical protein